ncbi:nuclear pore complex protein NUP1-like [Macadamia integrifolia]|uniref:nuclear pore complex protein NUP1-like n=1 Tax=Macadamia integrifolia TaxID=60698 RepID=UPI001C4FD5AC|nr:nuclear pore complex protein NUP1-like [Macadamia integrifolia]
MSTAAAGGYEGGAGGKFRKRPFRRQTTPYDRPVTALRNPVEGGNNNGWLSKIVDPASRIIARSAQSFFSSVFRKRLPAPETVSDHSSVLVHPMASVEHDHAILDDFSELIMYHGNSQTRSNMVIPYFIFPCFALHPSEHPHFYYT